MIQKITQSQYLRHPTKRHALMRFLLVLGVFVGYFTFVSLHYGIKQGFLVSILTWTFFVFCTPIADAGFLIDFPMRLITGIRMIYSEMMVWTIATSINVYVLLTHAALYQKTELLKLFLYILNHLYPYGGIILLSAAGTFLSVYFGDELIDVAHHHECAKYSLHRKKFHIIVALFFFAVMIAIYYKLIHSLGVSI